MQRDETLTKATRMSSPPALCEYRTRCISIEEGDWRGITNLEGNREVALRLERELRDMCVTRAFITKNGGNGRIVEDSFFMDEFSLPQWLPVSRNLTEPADAVWLGKRQAFIDLVNGQQFFLARCKHHNYLAGRYTDQMAECIANAYNAKGIESSAVTVTSFYASPVNDYGQADRFESDCRRLGMTICNRDPLDERFPYEGHADPALARMCGLGILMRL